MRQPAINLTFRGGSLRVGHLSFKWRARRGGRLLERLPSAQSRLSSNLWGTVQSLSSGN